MSQGVRSCSKSSGCSRRVTRASASQSCLEIGYLCCDFLRGIFSMTFLGQRNDQCGEIFCVLPFAEYAGYLGDIAV